MSPTNGKNPLENKQAIVELHEDEKVRDDTEREKQLGLSMLAKLALSVVVIVSLIISISCLMRFNQLEEERKALEEELAAYNKVIGELQYIINSPEDDEYIIQQAKEKLGYYFPDENIYYQDVND